MSLAILKATSAGSWEMWPYIFKGPSCNNEKIKRIYENEDLTYKTKLISENTGARIYKVEDKVELQNIDSFLIKKVLNGKYIYIYLYVSRNDKNIPEFMEFYKDFMENL